MPPTYVTTTINKFRKIAGSSDAADIDTGIGALADDLDPVIVPVGGMTEYAGSTDPSGGCWALCDGRELSRTTYAALFSAIGTTYGTGNGTTTFNIPNAKGRTIVSPDPSAAVIPNSNRALGQTGGEERHLSTAGESGMPAHSPTVTVDAVGDHTHSFSRPSSAISVSGPGAGAAFDFAGLSTDTTSGAGGHTHTASSSVGAQNAAQAHNNMQPYLVANRIIRIK